MTSLHETLTERTHEPASVLAPYAWRDAELVLGPGPGRRAPVVQHVEADRSGELTVHVDHAEPSVAAGWGADLSRSWGRTVRIRTDVPLMRLPPVAHAALDARLHDDRELSAVAREGDLWAFATSDRMELEGAVLVLGDARGVTHVLEWTARELLHVSGLALDDSVVCAVDDYLHKVILLDRRTGVPLTERLDHTDGPYSCALGETTVAVSYKLSGVVRLFARPDLALVRTVGTTPPAPSRIALTADAELALVFPTVGTLVVLDLDHPSRRRDWTVPGSLGTAAPLSRPRGLTRAGTSSLLVCDAGGRQIVQLDRETGRTLRSWPSPGRFPRCAVRWNGRLVVSDGDRGELCTLDPSSPSGWSPFRIVRQDGGAHPLQDPHNLLVHGTSLVVTDSGTHDVFSVSESGVVDWCSSDITGLVLRDPHETIRVGNHFWVVDSLHDRVVEIDPRARDSRVVLQLPAGSYPRSITRVGARSVVSARGGLVLLDGEASQPLTVRSRSIDVTFLEPARSVLYVAESHDLYIADYDRGQIYRAVLEPG